MVATTPIIFWVKFSHYLEVFDQLSFPHKGSGHQTEASHCHDTGEVFMQETA